jgi:hypothetical protein
LKHCFLGQTQIRARREIERESRHAVLKDDVTRLMGNIRKREKNKKWQEINEGEFLSTFLNELAEVAII